jgi:class 3 adenylate cyclase/tetratricopeptide (TPR) repeat protein
MRCLACTTDLPAAARFCPHCGTAAASLKVEERKVVTILFCDLADSSELSGLLDAEVLRAILLRYYAVMREQAESHGGTVEKFIGDAVVAVFGLVAREDDARLALAAALAMTGAMAGLNGDLERDHGFRLDVRVGVHTGEVVTTASPEDRQALVAGEVVNIAARLQAAAAPGQVLISDGTRRAAGSGLEVSSVGPLSLKGISAEVPAFRLLAVRDPAPEEVRRFDLPFVGRYRDLEALDLAWGRVAAQGDAHLLTLLGEAGIGKTRLAAEWLKRRSADVGIVGTGRCRSMKTGGSLIALADCLAPIIAALHTQRCASETDIDAAISLLQGGLLFDGSPSPSLAETSAALTHVIATISAGKPVLFVIDDCHRAEPTLMEVVDRLLDDLVRLPVMILCLARPDFANAFPSWGSGRANATTIMLGGLSTEESTLFAANLAEVAPHEQGRLEQLVLQADGNPLYLEQLGAAADEHFAGGLPPSLQALIAARIDGLDEAERRALRWGAVIGGPFGTDDLRCLGSDDDMPDDFDAVLRNLVRRRFIVPLRRPFGMPASYEFANAVTMRVAYECLTKRARSELHERYADCLAQRQCSDGVVAQHFVRAHRLQHEVGGPDERADRLRARAAAHLARAGALAMLRVDLPRANGLLQHALELSDPNDQWRAECLQHLGAVCLTLGCSAEAENALRQSLAEANRHGLPVIAAHATMFLARVQRDVSALEDAAKAALPIFAAAGDDLGLARSSLIVARSYQRRGRYRRAVDMLGPAIRHALAAQASQELANALGACGMSLWYGPDAAPVAIDRCERLLDTHGAERSAVQATLGFPLTVLYAIYGRSVQALDCLTETHRAMSSVSFAESLIFRPLLTALVASAQSRSADAEVALLEAVNAARTAPRGSSLIPTVSLELARLMLMQARWQEALLLVDELDVGSDQAEVAGYLGLRAWISASASEPWAAARFADRARAAAKRTDSPVVQALAFLDIAHATAVLGKRGAAKAAATAARSRFVAKCDLAGAARSQHLLDRLSEPRSG